MDLIKNNINSLDEEGNNIIHKIVENNDSQILKQSLKTLKKKELLKIINQKNYIGYTPLHCAITNHNQECAQILINNGADIRIITDDGYQVKWAKEKQQKGGNLKIIGIRFI